MAKVDLMNIDESAGSGLRQQRRPRWPYWVFVPTCALTYAVFCTWFMLEAWGRRGEPKPAWFDVAFVFACPGMFLVPVPFFGALIVGAGTTFVLVWLAQQFPRRIFPAPPHS